MDVPPIRRRLAAILAADVSGYSRLMAADEETTLRTLMLSILRPRRAATCGRRR